jgi:hypothetical protein
MLIADENISEEEIWRLREAGIPVRLIADVAAKSITDENVFPVLHSLKQPTFFSKDKDFWKHRLVHADYCLVCLDIPEHEGKVAAYMRRFLAQPDFNTKNKRMGKVVRVHVRGMEFYVKHMRKPHPVAWST